MNTSYWPIHSSSNLPNLATKLNNFWHSLLAHLDATTEPRVWQISDAADQPLWNAYDPITYRVIEHASADELRIWLEDLHYRN